MNYFKRMDFHFFKKKNFSALSSKTSVTPKVHKKKNEDLKKLNCEINGKDCTVSIFMGHKMFPLSFNFRVKQDTKGR